MKMSYSHYVESSESNEELKQSQASTKQEPVACTRITELFELNF